MMKTTILSIVGALAAMTTGTHAALVSVIDAAGSGAVDFAGTTTGNRISMSDFQTVINTVGDTSLAGVFDNETTNSGNLSGDDDFGDLASGLTITHTGGNRYGRSDVGEARGVVSGTKGMFIAGTDTFTLSAPVGRLFSHFGWVAWGTATDGYNATANFSGGGSATGTSVGNNGQTFIGFVAPSGESITSVSFTKSSGLSGYGGGDDIAFATVAVPEPSSTALLGLGGLALILRRRK
ncbi:MAG: PEP-CTERM sorting domain-containing protein [Akkermansiaceae bacterium]|nr:PEP-CTERM sorting domain-containing protein [Akkermansiaceae bacterium]